MQIDCRILLLLMVLLLGNAPIKGDDTPGKLALLHFADVISPRIYSFRPEYLDLKLEVKPFYPSDTVLVLGANEFVQPRILAFKDGMYKCMDQNNYAWLDINELGQIERIVYMADFMETIREQIGAIPTFDYLHSMPRSNKTMDQLLLEPKDFNIVLSAVISAPVEGKPIKMILRGFEIDTVTYEDEIRYSIKGVPVKPFRVYVEWNWYTYQPDKITRLPVLEAPLQFAQCEFLSKEDGTLIIPLYAVEELDSEMIPAFVQLKRDRHEQWVFDRYYPKDKAQFKSFMGHQLILNPTLYHFKGSDYYLDPLEMCFFKLEDDSYRWCLDDLPSTKVDDLFKWMKSNTSVINQIVTDQYVELTVGIIEPFERVDMEVYSYQLDLDTQKILQKKHLFRHQIKLTNQLIYEQGRYHKLFLDYDDELKIVRF